MRRCLPLTLVAVEDQVPVDGDGGYAIGAMLVCNEMESIHISRLSDSVTR